jgi:hypothetical protein
LSGVGVLPFVALQRQVQEPDAHGERQQQPAARMIPGIAASTRALGRVGSAASTPEGLAAATCPSGRVRSRRHEMGSMRGCQRAREEIANSTARECLASGDPMHVERRKYRSIRPMDSATLRALGANFLLAKVVIAP